MPRERLIQHTGPEVANRRETDSSMRGMPNPAASGAVGQFRKRIMEHKWRTLRERGYIPPATREEARKRLREAHGS